MRLELIRLEELESFTAYITCHDTKWGWHVLMSGTVHCFYCILRNLRTDVDTKIDLNNKAYKVLEFQISMKRFKIARNKVG